MIGEPGWYCEVVLATPDGWLRPLKFHDHARLLAELRDQTLPEFVREAVEKELIARIDHWASGLGHV
jgi:hypothetical protein